MVKMRNGKRVWSSISIWYNSVGLDEKFYEATDAVFDGKFLKDASDNVSWIDNLTVDDFEVDANRRDWVMYNCDGVGVLCSNIGAEKAHDEWDVISDANELS